MGDIQCLLQKLGKLRKKRRRNTKTAGMPKKGASFALVGGGLVEARKKINLQFTRRISTGGVLIAGLNFQTHLSPFNPAGRLIRARLFYYLTKQKKGLS